MVLRYEDTSLAVPWRACRLAGVTNTGPQHVKLLTAACPPRSPHQLEPECTPGQQAGVQAGGANLMEHAHHTEAEQGLIAGQGDGTPTSTHTRHSLPVSTSMSALHRLPRGTKVSVVATEDLVPGDVMVVEAGEVPADLVLLQGEVVLEESAITGESASATRVALSQHLGACKGWSGAAPPTHTQLLHGTQVLATGGSLCLAMVVASGQSTTKGQLVQQMLRSRARLPPLMREAFVVVGLLLIMGMAFYGWVCLVRMHGGMKTWRAGSETAMCRPKTF